MAEPEMRRGKTRKTVPAKGTTCPTSAGDGIVLLDLLDGNFRPIASNKGAEAILHDIGGEGGGADGSAGLSSTLLNLLNAQSELDGAVMYLNVQGHEYNCRTFVAKPQGDGIAQPVLALYIKQETSVANAVFQIGAEYRLTDREQEALIGVAMGLSSKELALRMNISPNTVKAFLRLIMIKMGATTRAGIVGKLIDQSGRPSSHSAKR
jgi:DNA-binding CsgD family transcriptional regulator